mmetsp:Transcript_34142/g.59615  ORF Transcript_34142/g.59615 Transcript_34142/m.59615 type:complete len:151 (+) Transcript_34142:3298-3750(+)
MFEEVSALVKDFMHLQTVIRDFKLFDERPYRKKLEAVERQDAGEEEEQRVKKELEEVMLEIGKLQETLASCEEMCRSEEVQLEQVKKQLAQLVAKKQTDMQAQAEEVRLIDLRIQTTQLSCVQARNRIQELKISKIEKRRRSISSSKFSY